MKPGLIVRNAKTGQYGIVIRSEPSGVRVRVISKYRGAVAMDTNAYRKWNQICKCIYLRERSSEIWDVSEKAFLSMRKRGHLGDDAYLKWS